SPGGNPWGGGGSSPGSGRAQGNVQFSGAATGATAASLDGPVASPSGADSRRRENRPAIPRRIRAESEGSSSYVEAHDRNGLKGSCEGEAAVSRASADG